jgi:CubicO group peptidase (beta-lactamase class C family)
MGGSSLNDRLAAAVGEHVPGVAVAVVGPDGVRDTASAGSADLASGRPASPEMVCPWFSMTKIVTATVAMRCVDSGRLDLDEPVIGFAPQMARLRPASDAALITSRHLLSHSAGLANPIPVSWIHRAGEPPPDPAGFLGGLLTKHSKLRFKPGERSSYSNLGTLLLGQVLATVTETPYVEIAKREVLDPLGMTMTGFAYSDPMSAAAATGYHPRSSPMRFLLPRWVIGPSSGRWLSFNRFLLDGSAYGGLVGPVSDAARFLQLHLCDGELEGKKLLEPATAEGMRKIFARGKRFDLGLGWFRPANQRGADPPFVEHLGGGAGFFNVIRLYPTRHVGIVVMGNATKYDIDAVAELALSD